MQRVIAGSLSGLGGFISAIGLAQTTQPSEHSSIQIIYALTGLLSAAGGLITAYAVLRKQDKAVTAQVELKGETK